MKLQTIMLLLAVAVVAWTLFGGRLAAIKSRLARGLRVGGLAYLAIIVYRLATTPMDQDQWVTIALSLAFFAALWVFAWLITRTMAR